VVWFQLGELRLFSIGEISESGRDLAGGDIGVFLERRNGCTWRMGSKQSVFLIGLKGNRYVEMQMRSKHLPDPQRPCSGDEVIVVIAAAGRGVQICAMAGKELVEEKNSTSWR